MLRTTWIILLFFLSIVPLCAQTPKDSLVMAFEQSPRKTDKDFEKTITIVRSLVNHGHQGKAEELAHILLKESKENRLTARQAQVYNLLGYTYVRRSSFEKALEYYKKSLNTYKQINNKKGEASSYGNISNVYYDLSNYKEALKYAREKLAIAREIKDKNIEAQALSSLGNIYGDQKDYTEALKLHQRALKIELELKEDLNQIANTYTSIGITKQLIKENDSAIYYLNKALDYALPHNKFTACYATRFIAKVYKKQNNTEQALAYFEQSIKYAEEINSPLEIMLTQMEMAQMFANESHTTKAIALANKVLATSQKLKFVKGEINAHKILYEAYQQEQHFEQALAHYKRYHTQEDSLNSLEEKKLINDLETQIKIDKETHNLKTAYQTAKSKWIAGIITLGFLIILTIIYFLFRSKNRKKAFDLYLKEKENQSQEKLLLGIQRERKRISQDLHDDLGGSVAGMQMFTEMICTQTTDSSTQTQLEKLLAIQKEITLKVRELIWFVGNESGTLESLIKYSHHYAKNLLENYPIELTTSSPEKVPTIQIPEKDRKNFFLSYKEALNNAIKHAKAKNITIDFEFKNDLFSIRINDNGKGFKAQNTSRFNYGLKNIESRMKEINALFEIQSSAKGTQVYFEKEYNSPLNNII
ncbi:MAG TPA: tetratricopeptide repeat protein [Flavobacterium sp.]|nr:tetratricopeptide repeat protein [Flavobacterium sp.]